MQVPLKVDHTKNLCAMETKTVETGHEESKALLLLQIN